MQKIPPPTASNSLGPAAGTYCITAKLKSGVQVKAMMQDGRPIINVNPNIHNHGHVRVNLDRGHQTFTISNNGNATLFIGIITLAGVNANVFRISNDNASLRNIDPGASCSVTVSVQSNITGVLNATLNIPSNDPNQAVTAVPLTARVSRDVVVVISVDWEGLNLLPDNIDAIANFRAMPNFAHIPLTHFLSAGYFTRSDVRDWPVIRNEMRRAMLPIDEQAVHVHCWHSLLDTAGVDQSGNNNWGRGADPYFNIWGDGGHANPLTDYTAQEVQAIIQQSIQGLQVGGQFILSQSYRSGGWVMNQAVRAGVFAAGLRIDSSAVPVQLVAGSGLADNILNAAWGGVNGVHTDTQPYLLPAAGGGQLREIPDNSVLADYVTVQQMNNIMAFALQHVGPEPFLVQIGFHQETASTLNLYNNTGRYVGIPPQGYLNRIINVLTQWHGDPNIWPHLEFLTVEQAANRFFP